MAVRTKVAKEKLQAKASTVHKNLQKTGMQKEKMQKMMQEMAKMVSTCAN